ncbi:class I SAM-dependent methyltransferase [Stratiformator vulcanicus]|uniref:dTDP-3-amino-3,4, 6-trideoxy-alpha-D-glucopyranose n=1 Tax=Stratiformator vulcanicus TaxID=2527980 RepID=A0A517QXH5_9PLAN|nr:class I SAM-dependent methyltransferase [Stratiformator vulcanicus]QDT36341.1 dTDP-3-amino-3,4,6-trideoxy-alpha-D-glucopyranose [Stratiformator vulcanicus]
MPETIHADLYDYPKYYDIIFGSDWAAEVKFLRAAFEKHGRKNTSKLFEPACGTGRLMYQLAKKEFEVSGCDLNEKAVEYCNKRLKRHGFPESAFVGDMADFKLPKKVDAAFNTINSFRHLPDEKSAVAHLKCIANHLLKGGIYVLGLHLTPTEGEWEGEEEWQARRGNLSVISQLRTTGYDAKKRMENLHMLFDIRTLQEHFRIEDTMHYRTYTWKQMQSLFKKIPEFETVETYDFCYDIDDPIEVDEMTEDVVYILKRT